MREGKIKKTVGQLDTGEKEKGKIEKVCVKESVRRKESKKANNGKELWKTKQCPYMKHRH